MAKGVSGNTRHEGQGYCQADQHRGEEGCYYHLILRSLDVA
jgi:hypothetical protein